MNKQIESLKLALTALEINLTLLEKITPYKGQEDFLSDAIAITQDTTTFIKKALAQTEQEPVAWVCMNNKKHDIDFDQPEIDAMPVGTMLYTHPPQRTWVGLFNEEIEVLFQTAAGADEEVHIRFARAIEAKMKELNT